MFDKRNEFYGKKPRLIRCHHCDKYVARSARVCPHCGGKNPTKQGQIISSLAALGLIVLCVVIVFILI